MNYKLHKVLLLAVVIVISACDLDTVYFHYGHTPIQGWEKNDTLTFDVGPIERPGIYDTNLGLRINGAYPFTTLALIVEKTIYPRKQVLTDTVICKLTSEGNDARRHGTSYSQYTTQTSGITLSPGDSIHITVRHCMKRDILPGISDIGMRISYRKKGI